METNYSLVYRSLKEGGQIIPLTIPSSVSHGWALYNPSIIWLKEKRKYFCTIRATSWSLVPELTPALKTHNFLRYDDQKPFETRNIFAVLDENFETASCSEITMLHASEPQWHWRGIEDLRLASWEGRIFASGTRRDYNPNGEGRIEILEINHRQADQTTFEIRRSLVELESQERTYCEKNWMPIEDVPFTFVRWADPTQIVSFDKSSKSSSLTHKSFAKRLEGVELRGGTQVIRWNSRLYVALVHEVLGRTTYLGRLQHTYLHRLVVWNNDFEILGISPQGFILLDSGIEFASGMCRKSDSLFVSFGFEDSTPFVLELKSSTVETMITEALNWQTNQPK